MAKAKAKRPTKSAKKSAGGVPFRKGFDARRGRGPAKGAPNAGRPPDEWKAQLRALVSRDAVLAHIAAVLDDPSHPRWFDALRWASEHGYGKATQPVEHTGEDGGPINIRVTRMIVRPDGDGN